MVVLELFTEVDEELGDVCVDVSAICAGIL
jgi:hypothetical protein